MRERKNDSFNKDELNFYNELNDFVTKLFNEFITEKDGFILTYNNNIKLLNQLKADIQLIENDMEYNDNVFNPNYSLEEDERKNNDLKLKVEKIKKENEVLQDRINSIENKIDEMDSMMNKIKNESPTVDVNNCDDDYKIEILRSQESERKRIARDIHDTVIQKLTNMIHKSEFTLKIMDADIIRAKLELMTMTNSLRDTIEEMRNIIYDLRPMAFDDIGIEVIIERELLKIKEEGIKLEYTVIGDNSNVDQIVQITLIRIIQEACNNALKHSNFTEFCVKIIYNEDSIEVYIKDNGKGFEVLNNNGIIYETKSGFGLSMMKERIYLLSGLINFDSGTDKGTQIYVKVPKCFREDKKNVD